jgi:ABC-2 type transport system permease protein
LIHTFPSWLKTGTLVAFPDQPAASQALEVGQIRAYYVIPGDYVATGDIFYVRPDFNPLTAFDQGDTMKRLLRLNLLGGNEKLADQSQYPLNMEIVLLAPASQRPEDNMLTFYLPYGVMMLFYIIIMVSSSLLLSSVTKEKENRVMEILMSTLTSRQLLAGKITGLGIAGLLQAFLWMLTGFLLLRASGSVFQLLAAFQLPPSIVAWGLLFFVLGYAVYASLMAAIGALVPNLREASQATFIVILPLLVPMMLISTLVDQPNGALAIFFSLFPLTSPVMMVTRMAATSVPFWQAALSVFLLALTAVFIVRAVANMFSAQTLLSGQPFSVRHFINALAGRG